MNYCILQLQATVWTWEGWVAVSAFSALLAARSAGLYTWFTYHLLQQTKNSIDTANKLAEFQIYSKIADQLSSEKALAILDIIESNEFEIEEIEQQRRSAEFNSEIKIIPGKDVRRFILSPMEDLAKFRDDELLSLQAIDTGFGNTILMVGSRKPIVDYVKYLRTEVYKSDNIHCGFESLFEAELERCMPAERRNYTNFFAVE